MHWRTESKFVWRKHDIGIFLAHRFSRFIYTRSVYRKCKRPIHRCTLRRCWIQYFSLAKKLSGCIMWCNVDQKCVRCSWKMQKNKKEFKTRRQCRPSGNRYTNKIIIFRFIIFNLFHLSCYYMGHTIASHWLLLTQGGSIPVFFLFCFLVPWGGTTKQN